jgi:hypothetical protein
MTDIYIRCSESSSAVKFSYRFLVPNLMDVRFEDDMNEHPRLPNYAFILAVCIENVHEQKWQFNS